MTVTSKEKSEISLVELVLKTQKLIRYLRNKWLRLLLITIIAGIVGVAYAWWFEPEYEAVVTFSTESEKNTGAGIAGLAAQFGFNIGSPSDVFNGDNLLALIQSKKILTRSLLKADTINNRPGNLLNYYMQIEGDKKYKKFNVSFPVSQPLSTYSRLQDSVLGDICNNLLKYNISGARIDKKLDIFSINCVHESDVFAQHLAQHLIVEVALFYTETKTKQSSATVNALQKRADSIRQAYNTALSGRATLSDMNLNLAFQQPSVGIQRTQTDITVLATAYTEIIKNLEIAKFNLLQNTPLVQVIDEPVLPLRKIKKSRLIYGIAFGFLAFVISIIYISAKYYFNARVKQLADNEVT